MTTETALQKLCWRHGRPELAATLLEQGIDPIEASDRFEAAADFRKRFGGHFDDEQMEQFVTAWLSNGSIGLANAVIDFMAGGVDYRH
jgi:hypothetical protein